MLGVGVWDFKLGEKAVHVEVEKQVFGGSMLAGPAETMRQGPAPVLGPRVPASFLVTLSQDRPAISRQLCADPGLPACLLPEFLPKSSALIDFSLK